MQSLTLPGLRPEPILRSIFNRRYAGVICLLLAVLNKCVIAFVYSDLEGDKSLYLLFAKSFLETGLLAEPVSIIGSPITFYTYNPAVYSPLYSLFAAPFLWLTGSFFSTQLLLSFFSWVLFFTGLYKVAQLVLKEIWIVNLFVLCAGFFLYPHELDAGPKDTFAVAFTLWSVYLGYGFIENKITAGHTSLLIVTLVCMALIKFMYAPLVLVLLALLLVFGHRTKRYALHYIYVVGGLAVIAALVFITIIKPVSQLEAVIHPVVQNDGTSFVRGFFPGNLHQIFPFITSSLINTTFWGVQIEARTGTSFSQVMQGFRIADILLLIALLSLLFYRRMHTSKVLWVMTCITMAMVGLVSYLSITNQAFSYKSGTGVWTFVSDARSFLFPMLALQILSFLFVFKTKAPRTLRLFVLFLFVFECLHGIYFSGKAFIKKGEINAAKTASSSNKQIVDKYIKMRGKEEGIQLVTSDNILRRYALIGGHPAYTFGNAAGEVVRLPTTPFVVATYPQDSTLLKVLPAGKMKLMDTVPPYIVHFYKPL